MAEHLRQAPDLRIHTVESGYVVRNVATNAVHQLNGTAALMLELCTGDATADQIVADVQQTFALSARQLPGIRQALEALINTGLVLRVPSGRERDSRQSVTPKPTRTAAKARASRGRGRRLGRS
jgi:hypothetical protein